jgi:queuine tRNA-ribosyltransferase
LFKIVAEDGAARAGEMTLAHGKVETPIFMPVGTVGSVKTLVPEDLRQIGAQIILGNTYHLYLRPGLEVIRAFGGLHKFISWDRPILTDSGGFQVFSLAKLNKLNETGAFFQSHLDGSRFELTPELAVEIQETLGSDIHMVLDECTPYPATHEVASHSMERSMRWAARCRAAKTREELCQFGIVQGGVYPDLRKKSCEALQAIGFEGYAIGGLSVGEPKEDMRSMTAACCLELPKDRPRYLMGVGTPLDIVESVALGIDMFDCVMPTRNGRNGMAFTSQGRVNLKNQKYKLEDRPLDPVCSCYTCQTFSLGYLRHLYTAGEMTAMRLISLHNLAYYLNLASELREAIKGQTLDQLVAHHRALWDR